MARSKQSQVYISHLAQDLAPGLSRADFYRVEFVAAPKTRLAFLSIVASAFVGPHPYVLDSAEHSSIVQVLKHDMGSARILSAFPVNQVSQGYERAQASSFSLEYVYDNAVRLDLKKPSSPPTLDLYVKVDATHSEPVELRFECHFRLAVDSFDRVFTPALWHLPTQLTGSLHLKAVRSPGSSAPSTPKEELSRRLWTRTRQPSYDGRHALTEVQEEVQIAEEEDTNEQWRVYSENLPRPLPSELSLSTMRPKADPLCSALPIK